MNIAQLTHEHEKAARALMDGIKQRLPVGTVLCVEMRGRKGKTMEAEVIAHGHAWCIRYPHEIRVRNIKTGKARVIDVHPENGHRYSVIG